MALAKDADGFAIPHTPSATGSQADVPSLSGVSRSSSGGGKTLVESPMYCKKNLRFNDVVIEDNTGQPFPARFEGLVSDVGARSGSPRRTSEDVQRDIALKNLEKGMAESGVEDYFREHIFHNPPPNDTLQVCIRQAMLKETVPCGQNMEDLANMRVSQPCPDMLYGVTLDTFSEDLQKYLYALGDILTANTAGLQAPFLLVEYKGDKPLWVASNQAFGGMASSVNIVHRLHQQLLKRDKDAAVSFAPFCCAFGLAINADVGRLYFSWKEDNGKVFVIRKVRSFALQEPDQFLLFEMYARNILDWGKTRRLQAIQTALEKLKVAQQVMPPTPQSGRASPVAAARRRRSSAASAMSCD